jgi:pyruvate kinase
MRTKIVCTLGPATDNDDVMRSIMRAGMDVARLNFSHGTHNDHARRIAQVKRIAAEQNARVALMGDLQGPKFRVGDLGAVGVTLVNGETVVIGATLQDGVIPFPHHEVIAAVSPNQKLLIDDGAMTLQVMERIDETTLRCCVVNGGVLTSRKGVSAPGVKVAISSITEKDRDDLRFAVEQDVGAVALSFVRRADDARELRELIKQLGGNQLIVAKIEKPEAMEDLHDIVHASDAVMVARGDLGVEASPEQVPFFQKRIIKACRCAGKPVITATQMLQSMIHAPTPTRAEASDVANAVLDGTDAVMLSAETSTGEFPVQAVEAMARIAQHAEEHALSEGLWVDDAPDLLGGEAELKTDAITTAACAIAKEIGAKAIVCATRTGHTARMVSRHRPQVPIICLTFTQRALRYANFMWGVESEFESAVVDDDLDVLFNAASQTAQHYGLCGAGDEVVIIAGVPLGGGAGMTNLIKIQKVK